MLLGACAVEERDKILRVGKDSGPILSRLWTKLRKFWTDVGDPFYFPTPLPDCLYHVSFRRYSPLSVEVVENRTNVYSF